MNSGNGSRLTPPPQGPRARFAQDPTLDTDSTQVDDSLAPGEGAPVAATPGLISPHESSAYTTRRASLAEQLRPVDDGLDAQEQELINRVWTHQNLPSPYNANTTPTLASQVRKDPDYEAAYQAMNQLIADGGVYSEEELMTAFQNALNQAHANSTLGEFGERIFLLREKFPKGNIMELLFLVFRESIKSSNEDKRIFLSKLQDQNKMGEALSDYLDYLTDKSQELESKKTEDMSAGAKQDVEVSVVARTIDLSSLDSQGRATFTEDGEKPYKGPALTNLIKDVEASQENLRNRRQISRTFFENADQKTNQLYMMMSTVVKTMNELKMAPIKNLL